MIRAVGRRGWRALPSPTGADGSRWASRSSKPVTPHPVWRGGFDSHAFPPWRRRSRAREGLPVDPHDRMTAAEHGDRRASSASSPRSGRAAPYDADAGPAMTALARAVVAARAGPAGARMPRRRRARRTSSPPMVARGPRGDRRRRRPGGHQRDRRARPHQPRARAMARRPWPPVRRRSPRTTCCSSSTGRPAVAVRGRGSRRTTSSP